MVEHPLLLSSRRAISRVAHAALYRAWLAGVYRVSEKIIVICVRVCAEHID